MNRRNGLALLLAALVAGAAALVPATAGHAAAQLDVTLTCDAVTGVTAAVARGDNGTWTANKPLRIVFRSMGGSYATGTSPTKPVYPTDPVGVPVTTSAAGGWTAVGGGREWPAGATFYQEKMRFHVEDPATGQILYSPIERACTHDTRTTTTFACDPEAHTTDVRAAGTGYVGVSRVDVSYRIVRTWTFHEPDLGFVGHGETLVRSASVEVQADGSWSDPGIQHGGSDGYYLASEYRIEVRHLVQDGSLISSLTAGWGEGLCVTADKRPAPTATPSPTATATATASPSPTSSRHTPGGGTGYPTPPRR